MRLSLSSASLQDWNGDVLVAGVLEGDAAGTIGRLEQRFPGLNAALEAQEFKAKASEQVALTPLSSSPSKVVVLGLGKAERLDLDALRLAAARAAKASIGRNGRLGVLLPWDGLDPANAARSSAEAVQLALYKDQRFRKEADPRRVPEALELIGLPDSAAAALLLQQWLQDGPEPVPAPASNH